MHNYNNLVHRLGLLNIHISLWPLLNHFPPVKLASKVRTDIFLWRICVSWLTTAVANEEGRRDQDNWPPWKFTTVRRAVRIRPVIEWPAIIRLLGSDTPSGTAHEHFRCCSRKRNELDKAEVEKTLRSYKKKMHSVAVMGHCLPQNLRLWDKNLSQGIQYFILHENQKFFVLFTFIRFLFHLTIAFLFF